MFHIEISIFDVQQDIAIVSDAAVRTYYEKTKQQDRTPKGVHDAMTQAAIAAIKGYRTEFDKQSAIANPKNGVGFLEEVCHFLCLQMHDLYYIYFWCWVSFIFVL